jgi:hypothetical protein
MTAYPQKKSSAVFHSFLWKEMFLSNGLTNGIINAVICYFLSAESSNLHNYMIGTLISNVILSIILIYLYPVLIRQKLRKEPQLIIPYTKDNHLLLAAFPDNGLLTKIILILICILLPTLLTMGLIVCMNVSEISQIQGALFRGIDCAAASVLAYYLSVVFLKQKQ